MERREFLKKTLAAGAIAAVAGVVKPKAFAAAEKSAKPMKIMILTGSPRRNGNSSALADSFAKGAAEAGHSVLRFDAAFKNVHPCVACDRCGMNGDCVFDDDFNFVRDNIVDADLVAFASPMYYFGLSAQLKTVIDRFYAINGKIHTPKKAVLLMTYANTRPSQAVPIESHYDVLLDYLGWTDAGRVIASGVWRAGAVNQTRYPRQAYELGKSL